MGQNSLARISGHRKVDRVHVEHVGIDIIAELINLLGLLVESPQLVVAAAAADQNCLAVPLIFQNIVAAAADKDRVHRRAIGIAHDVADRDGLVPGFGFRSLNKSRAGVVATRL